MVTPFSTFGLALGLALLAGTVHSVKQNLIRREADRFRPFAVWMIGASELLLWLAVVLAFVASAPHPVMIVMVALFIVAIVTARRLRYREEQQALNRWLQAGSERDVFLPSFLDRLASGFRSKLAIQSKRCVRHLNRGMSVADAARKANLPVDASTLASIMMTQPVKAATDQTGQSAPLSDTYRAESQPGLCRTSSLVPQQLTYIVVTTILAWGIGIFVRRLVVPLVDDMLDEFSIKLGSVSLSSKSLEGLGTIGDVTVAILLIWVVFAFAIRWLPGWMVARVPWFGRAAIERWRSEILATLHRGMCIGHGDRDLVRSAAQASAIRAGGGRWIRWRCRNVYRLLEGGLTLPRALRRAGMITAREEKWLSCSSENGNLAGALRRLSGDLVRRQQHRWRIRMAWLVPLATVLVGAFVLAHAVYLFGFLVNLVRAVA